MADLTTLLSNFLTQLYSGFGTGSNYNPSGVLSSQFTPVSNVTTGETDLMSYTLKANALGVNGKGIRITAWGTTSANGNTKTLKFYLGGVVLNAAMSGAANGQRWRFQYTILRVTAATQTFYSSEGLTGIVDSFYVGTAAADLTIANIIKVTGQSGTASADVTQTGMQVEALP